MTHLQSDGGVSNVGYTTNVEKFGQENHWGNVLMRETEIVA